MAIIAIISAYGGYKLGDRFSTKEEKVKIKYRRIENRDIRTEKRIERPDGTVETIVTEDKTKVATKEKKRSEVKIERLRPKWRVGLQSTLIERPPIFGASVSRRIIGDLFVGVYARTDSEIGVLISYDF